jgi:NAD-dependent dihydropyrimidine dehydrogenase PreA subunit
MRWGRDFWNGPYVKEYEVDLSRAKGGARRELVRLPVRQRTLNEETEKGFTPEAAKEEAERCLSCGRAAEMNQTCWYCLPCEIECPVDALEVRLPYLIR